MRIRLLRPEEPLPTELLLLADPSQRIVEDVVRRGKVFVAEADGEIVGEYVLLPTRPDTVELVNVAVREDKQGRGIGKALVAHAVEQAKRRHYRTIEVGTGNSGVGQLALYQKCGFAMTWIDKDFFVRHYEEPIYENGIRVVDMVRMAQHFDR